MFQKKKENTIPFNDQLVLFRYILSLFGLHSLSSLSAKLNCSEYEGFNKNQNTYYYEYLDRLLVLNGDNAKLSRDKLRLYDENICRHTKQIGEKRGGITLKYFQYISLLFTEIYLDKYFSDRAAFAVELNEYLSLLSAKTLGELSFSPYTPDTMNKLAFMCATGSGKTLIMHINILQFFHYLRRAQRLNSHLEINKVILLSPNEGLSLQHLEELNRSSISAVMFQKDMDALAPKEDVLIIDMNKLKEEGKVKTVSIDSFEQNNLVLVDEAHRGLAGDVWYDYRSRLSVSGGFSFEYSATFKQALKSLKSTKKDRLLFEEYSKSILMDYSYRYFYSDGYGKEYRIYNLSSAIEEKQQFLYLTGCLVSYYQQLKLFEVYGHSYEPFQIQKPLLVFVGNRVIANTGVSELTDIEEILAFLNSFIYRSENTISCINAILNEDTGLMDGMGNELFSQDFTALKEIFGNAPAPHKIYKDMLHLLFHCDSSFDAPRMHMVDFRQVPGEIGLKIGEYGTYFGVISVGDTSALLKNCQKRGIHTYAEEFNADSLFLDINKTNSNINLLIGSRKFTEGWNSWRVSTMGLINFAKREGSQAIQLFGRGVRLQGYQGCLKRSRRLDDKAVDIPKYIDLLETLTIFGVKAQYMEDFKRHLELEDLNANEKIYKFTLPVKSRFDSLNGKKLKVIRVRADADFKRQSPRLVLDVPDSGFFRYLLKNRIVIDCRSKVQTIESSGSMQLLSVTEERVVEKKYLPYLNYSRMGNELQAYKEYKQYYNISIDTAKLKDIFAFDGWYSLIIPKIYLEIDTPAKLESVTDYCILAIKSYLDKFYKFRKAEWEAPRLEYRNLTANDANFVPEYTVYYTESAEGDAGEQILGGFLDTVSQTLKKEGALETYEKSIFRDAFVLFDLPQHLYAPLVSVRAGGPLSIQVSPVSLNHGEKRFVDLLHDYLRQSPPLLQDKSVYLIRNKSKTGMGFFEAGSFYPDFVLWIDTRKTQYISFIDPKGLMHMEPENSKIEFYRTIKDLEQRLQPTCPEKTVKLSSFILSDTQPASLQAWWNKSEAELEERNVLSLSKENCIAVMMEKILQEH